MVLRKSGLVEMILFEVLNLIEVICLDRDCIILFWWEGLVDGFCFWKRNISDFLIVDMFLFVVNKFVIGII